ncbi:MAG: hypothetical protein KAK00_05945 [Nanoarchaeota archaeon]|nr:hypothetical protein [Nanoarchaeota archaeon]
MKKINLDELEDVRFKIDKEAFKPKTLTCSRCNLKMKKAEIEVNLEGDVSVKASGFECPKCKKKYLGLEESRKLDKALIVSRILKNDFKMERSLSFDGDNFTFRVPKEFTHDVHKRKIEIIPLGAKQFCATIE